jgi:hypothetical protein
MEGNLAEGRLQAAISLAVRWETCASMPVCRGTTPPRAPNPVDWTASDGLGAIQSLQNAQIGT